MLCVWNVWLFATGRAYSTQLTRKQMSSNAWITKGCKFKLAQFMFVRAYLSLQMARHSELLLLPDSVMEI